MGQGSATSDAGGLAAAGVPSRRPRPARSGSSDWVIFSGCRWVL